MNKLIKLILGYTLILILLETIFTIVWVLFSTIPIKSPPFLILQLFNIFLSMAIYELISMHD